MIIGGIGLLVAAVGAQYLVDMSNARKAAQPQSDDANSDHAEAADNTSQASASASASNDNAKQSRTANNQSDQAGAATGAVDELMSELFSLWGGSWKDTKAGFFAKNFYDGGFEEKMTKREAALILGTNFFILFSFISALALLSML